MAIFRRSSRTLRVFALTAALGACSRETTNGAPPNQPGPGGDELLFTGMCDASGAVPLNEDNLFAVADDEDNVLRIFDASQGGEPRIAFDLSSGLRLKRGHKKGKRRHELRKAPETDIEGGTRLGNLALWITSHGRNSSGKLKPERLLLFATTAPERGVDLEVVGEPYAHLLDDLLADPRFTALGLNEAAELAPKEEGGLNIEGITAWAEGGVLVGFRNPLIDGKALLFVLENPERVLHGEAAKLGPPIFIDLGGMGVRSLSSWRGRYLISAGAYGEGDTFRLYTWDGASKPRLVRTFEDFSPEGFYSPDSKDRILLLSDDGGVSIHGTECKRIKDPSEKRFRGLWVKLP